MTITRLPGLNPERAKSTDGNISPSHCVIVSGPDLLLKVCCSPRCLGFPKVANQLSRPRSEGEHVAASSALSHRRREQV
jgi:hypothetical protein